MAIARKCDKCGELYEEYDLYSGDFTVSRVIEGLAKSMFTCGTLDLCPSCQVDLTLWMQGKAEFTLKEVTDDGTDRI